MIVVSDTTAITTLLKAGMEDLLQRLFTNVTIPQAVWDELLAFHSQLPNFILLRVVQRADRRLQEIGSLGHGEIEAITLAKELNADLLLTDDLKARKIATGLNIKCSGLLGLLLRAKQHGHISSVREEMGRLETRGGLYLSDSVKAEALKLAGEAI
jgi:hypothetical protein